MMYLKCNVKTLLAGPMDDIDLDEFMDATSLEVAGQCRDDDIVS